MSIPTRDQDGNEPLASGSGLSPDKIAALAADAYVFGFPALEMQRLRYNYAFAPTARMQTPFNTFRHIRVLATPNSREVTAPNNDTLYSSAWLDLSAGPVRLSTPPLGDRYYSYAFMDFFTNVFEIVGRRKAPGGGGRYLIVGPDWRGEVPADVAIIMSPTNSVWLLARFLVDGRDDLAAVHALQDGSILASAPMPDNVDLLRHQTLSMNASIDDDIARLFNGLNSVLAENPPLAADAPMMERLSAIGVGPGLTFRAGSDEAMEAVRRGVAEARAGLGQAAAALHQAGANGEWNRPDKAVGNFGTNYELRAVIALALIAALPPEEAIYMTTRSDSDGVPLTGANSYALRFAKGDLPPVQAFWSLTMYEIDDLGRAWLVRNDLRRSSIGDRTPNLTFAEDGSLELRIEHILTDAANLLPAPAGPFTLCLRVYEPKQALLDGSYAPPVMVRRF